MGSSACQACYAPQHPWEEVGMQGETALLGLDARMEG